MPVSFAPLREEGRRQKAEGSYVAMQCGLQTHTDCEPPNQRCKVGGLNPWLPLVEIEGSDIHEKG